MLAIPYKCQILLTFFYSFYRNNKPTSYVYTLLWLNVHPWVSGSGRSSASQRSGHELRRHRERHYGPRREGQA